MIKKLVVFLITLHLVGLALVGLFFAGTSETVSAAMSGVAQHQPQTALVPALSRSWPTGWVCPRCGLANVSATASCSRCGQPSQMAGVQSPYNPVALPAASPYAPMQVALTQPQGAAQPGLAPAATAPGPDPAAAGNGGLPSPRQQNAADKEFIEGHWLGLEVIPLTPELAQEYRIPAGEQGVLVDEITLEAAESGILAGDMVHAIEGQPTPDLRAFFHATLRVKERGQAQVEVGRQGTIRHFTMVARNTNTLGFSQMEAAQPIRPGALSPHRQRSKPCTSCHIIMESGGQLPTDAGDILPSPPPIPRGSRAIHPYRGPCNTCHRLL